MQRVTTIILTVISAVYLLIGVVFLSQGGGVHGTSSCTTALGETCTPQVQQVQFLFGGPLLVPGLAFTLFALLVGMPAWIASAARAAREGRTSRGVIQVLSVVATAWLIVAVSIGLIIARGGAPQVCLQTDCATGPLAVLFLLVGVAIQPLVVCALICSPAWVIGLVRTAHLRRWGWFAAVLVFSPISTLIYGFFGPESVATMG